jgi:hypothetical protein
MNAREINAREGFIRATFALAKSQPAVWAEFYQMFNAYTVSELERATGTTTADMAVSLGMSRRMVDLRNDFRDIEEIFAKVYKNR